MQTSTTRVSRDITDAFDLQCVNLARNNSTHGVSIISEIDRNH